MLRQRLLETTIRKPSSFRWRGGDVSRLEGLSDAVFGFAITLLVVSLEVPQTFSELIAAMRGFFGFAICFGLLALVWFDHYIFFRKYGLKDGATVVLNLILLFVVMFYVYPLKFLFTLLAGVFVGSVPLVDGKPPIESSQIGSVMIIYGAGFVAIYTLFTLMYVNALRQREALALNALEVYDTRATIKSSLILISIGVLSILFASTGNRLLVTLSGPLYFLIGPSMGLYWTFNGRRRRRLEREHAAEETVVVHEIPTAVPVAAEHKE